MDQPQEPKPGEPPAPVVLTLEPSASLP
jgi:hypothetical protein